MPCELSHACVIEARVIQHEKLQVLERRKRTAFDPCLRETQFREVRERSDVDQGLIIQRYFGLNRQAQYKLFQLGQTL